VINNYVKDAALQSGLILENVSVVEGITVGVVDSYLVYLASGNHEVSALVYQQDFENLRHGRTCDRLSLRIRNAIARLKMLLEP
jgi:hypothetical protein